MLEDCYMNSIMMVYKTDSWHKRTIEFVDSRSEILLNDLEKLE